MILLRNIGVDFLTPNLQNGTSIRKERKGKIVKVTKDYIVNYLATATREKQIEFVGRALVVIFNNQTTTEQRSDVTCEDNGVGFTGADAYGGGLTAKSFLKNKTLLDWQYDKWVKPNAKGVARIAKYWKQLDAAAQLKSTKVSQPAAVKVPAVVMPQAEFLPEDITQAEMDEIEREMDRMVFEAELESEQRAMESKFMRDELIAQGAIYDRETGRCTFA